MLTVLLLSLVDLHEVMETMCAWSVFLFHVLVVEHEKIASLAAAEHLEETVADVGMFQFLSWKLFVEDGLSCPWLSVPRCGAYCSLFASDCW